ncbi:MAG TPA: transglutaminase family protein, partial [Beijerinckiaceae bacterium]
TLPPPGKPRLEGADASHAWVDVWCGPEFGWLGLDPTNDLMIGDEHVVVAVGRDYADVSPVDGVFVGSGAHQLAVSVDVKPLRD